MPCQSRALDPHQALPEDGQESIFFLVASSVHACAESIHVIQHLGVGVKVLDIFCTADELAVNEVRLRVRDNTFQLTFGLAVGEPRHLKGQFRRPRPHHAPQLSEQGRSEHVDVVDEGAEGLQLRLGQCMVLQGAQRKLVSD